ncbi:hypothetical protein CcrBL47_gp187 [Caulobacter phage BL47]|nr:hypothetical protein CcrBL47_gp187 [Caulobacter phage BL47]UTU10033.1 hypothetical protein CcrRB23_gp171 [Caulobacter phage RB23]
MPPRVAPGEPRTDEAQATYVAALNDAYRDCKSTVGAVKVRRDALDQRAFEAKPWFEKLFKKGPKK